jgi:hypothetical protein
VINKGASYGAPHWCGRHPERQNTNGRIAVLERHVPHAALTETLRQLRDAVFVALNMDVTRDH